MTRIKKTLSLMLLTAMIIGTQACNKVWDLIKNSKDGVYTQCRIVKIEDTGDAGTLTFYYNSHGNPDSIASSIGNTGFNSVWFKYDNKQRLIESAYYSWEQDRFIYWSKYYYDNKGRIVKDTSYTYGRIVNGQPSWHSQNNYSEYEYDSKDRITKVSTKNQDPYSGNWLLPSEDTYSYDADNNQVRTGVVYDNKLSIYRTNKVWMFMSRDYSVNNPFTATSYNNKHLPVKYEKIGAQQPLIFLNYYRNKITNATITWDCK